MLEDEGVVSVDGILFLHAAVGFAYPESLHAGGDGFVVGKGLGEGREGNVVPVGSCGLSECVKVGCDMIEWGKKETCDDPAWKIGKGFAMIMQGSGLPGLDHAEAIAKLETDGTVILNSGGADLGTGLDTISAKIVCEVLKVPMERNFISQFSGNFFTDGEPDNPDEPDDEDEEGSILVDTTWDGTEEYTY